MPEINRYPVNEFILLNKQTNIGGGGGGGGCLLTWGTNKKRGGAPTTEKLNGKNIQLLDIGIVIALSGMISIYIF